jgi:hypothetical protein
MALGDILAQPRREVDFLHVRFFRLLRRRLAVIVLPDYLKYNLSNRSNSLNAAVALQALRIRPTDLSYNAR